LLFVFPFFAELRGKKGANIVAGTPCKKRANIQHLDCCFVFGCFFSFIGGVTLFDKAKVKL
jgi:hypothetical protein